MYLPKGWLSSFQQRIVEAEAQFGKLSVVGIYGVMNSTLGVVKAGNVIDREHPLRETTPMPQLVNSLDELLIAVRKDAELEFDGSLGRPF